MKLRAVTTGQRFKSNDRYFCTLIAYKNSFYFISLCTQSTDEVKILKLI